MSHAAVPEDVRNERGITFGLFRLSVGLEQPQELIADLNYAQRRLSMSRLLNQLQNNVLVADVQWEQFLFRGFRYMSRSL